MIPELGLFALILGLCMAIILGVVPLVGSFIGQRSWMAVARPAALAQLFFVALSYACLTWTFISDDFSVLYTANTNNSGLPLIYKISGVWGGHEGSILLWVFILSVWVGAVAVFSARLPAVLLARVLSVLGLMSIGFLLFVLLTSNPFERLFPIPPDGASLNPLLQDPGMAAHPPMLYMGYVGFAVAFAFAIAALLEGKLDAATLRWMRPWTNIAWMFLTIGIALGSYWANRYRINPFIGSIRKAWRFQVLDGAAGGHGVFVEFVGHLFGSFRCPDLCACFYKRSRAR